jgi:hypothetical protein
MIVPERCIIAMRKAPAGSMAKLCGVSPPGRKLSTSIKAPSA